MSLSAKCVFKSCAVYEKSGLEGINVTTVVLSRRLGYSSKVGKVMPIFPSMFSMMLLINSAAPFPTTTYSGFISKFFPARRLLTFTPEGY